MQGYELRLNSEATSVHLAAPDASSASLPENMLLENARWFCRLRWLVVAILVGFGACGLFPELLRSIGLRPPSLWPFAVAFVLALGNLAFWGHTRTLGPETSSGNAAGNLWGQIGFDLFVLTGVVHHVGSLETYAPFAYLFHIALACIFLSRRQSSAVTALACLLYVACVLAEETELISPSGIYAEPSLREHIHGQHIVAAVNVSSAIVIFGVVWLLASHLSAMVRERDHKLAETNDRLINEQKAKVRHMLRTTHELKAPFAAIHANTQLLLKGHCGELPEDALDVIGRISTRCRRLALEIQEMLQLANLRDEPDDSLSWTELDLDEMLDWCLGQVQASAQEREVEIDAEMQPVRVRGVGDHVKMLFSNLLSNAVNYSHPGGTVRLKSSVTGSHRAQVTVKDEGIGIPADKLPRIFEEYYRTNEAARHNKESTGLGLAIVRHVCETHGIHLHVDSKPEVGTTFTLTFPPVSETGITKGGEEGAH